MAKSKEKNNLISQHEPCKHQRNNLNNKIKMYKTIITALAISLTILYGMLFYLAYDIISNTTEYNFATLLVLGCILYITLPLFKLIFYAGFYYIFLLFKWCY